MVQIKRGTKSASTSQKGKFTKLKENKLAVAIIGGLLFLWALDFAWNGLSFVRRLDTIFHSHPSLWILLAASITIPYAIFYKRGMRSVKENRDRFTYSYSKPVSTFASAVLPAHIIAGVGIIFSFIYFFAVQNYLTNHAYSQRAVVVEQATSFNDRAPWVVANTYAARDQGSNVGTRGDVNHVPVPGGESSRYTTIITGRGFMNMVGYDSIREYDLPKVGAIPQSAASSCEMPSTMDKRWNTFWPTRSLERELSFKSPLSHWDSEDLYGYCKDGKPVVVQPLWKYDGWWTVTKVAAGAAIYDESGLRILSADELVKEKIEGPTYPASLVQVEFESLTAMGSIGDWYANRSGYELTDKDDADTNMGNNSGFTLVGTDNKLYYATPLTPRGTSQSIVALMVAEATQGKQGDSFMIQTGLDLVATSTIENNLKSASVAGDTEWVTRWSAGMRVYEMVPNKNGHWTASIGLGQVVNYRADIAPDGSVSITRTDGGKASTDPKDTVTVKGSKPLSEMSKEELAELIKEATDELASRK